MKTRTVYYVISAVVLIGIALWYGYRAVRIGD